MSGPVFPPPPVAETVTVPWPFVGSSAMPVPAKELDDAGGRCRWGSIAASSLAASACRERPGFWAGAGARADCADRWCSSACRTNAGETGAASPPRLAYGTTVLIGSVAGPSRSPLRPLMMAVTVVPLVRPVAMYSLSATIWLTSTVPAASLTTIRQVSARTAHPNRRTTSRWRPRRG